MKSSHAHQIIAKTKKVYNLISDHFSSTRQYNWSEIKKLVQKYVISEQNILDIGCGNGRLLRILPTDIYYTGIDLSEKLINQAKQNIKTTKSLTSTKKPNPKVTFKVGNILDLPHTNNTFDIIFAIAVLHHIPSIKLRKKALTEIYRVLKPNGIFIMTNWDLNQPKYQKYINKNHEINAFLDQNDSLIPWKNPQKKIISNRYYHVFNLHELKKTITSTDFSIIKNYKNGHNLVSVSTKKI